jgi:hypothetical protein
MPQRSILATLALSVLLYPGPVAAEPRDALRGEQESLSESVCRLIEISAHAQSLPVAFLTRLIWRESGFQPQVTSPAGAQGIAQFMPGTARAREVRDPFDPEEAIPKSADLLADLKRRFGNLGLAAAAYNAGPARLAGWIAGGGYLPSETRDFVLIITRHPVEDWTAASAATLTDDALFPEPTCLQATNGARLPAQGEVAEGPLLAPWGVQISGSFSKAAALAAYARVRGAYAAILGDVAPMVVGARMRSRGFARFYGVRAPAATRADANALCSKILRAGGACVVLRS